jgi:hypothetical protein
MFKGLSIVSIAQTSQLLQLILNSAVMMVIALIWWGVIVFRLNLVSNQMQRIRRQYHRTQAADGHQKMLLRLRHHRHELRVRYRLTRHSVLIMHYVLLGLIASLFFLSLRALINSNLLITAALVLFVLGAAGILLSVALALTEFYQLNVLAMANPALSEAGWDRPAPLPSAMMAVSPQYPIGHQAQNPWVAQSISQEKIVTPQDRSIGPVAS